MNPVTDKSNHTFNYAMGLFAVALTLMCFSLVMVYASSATIGKIKDNKTVRVAGSESHITPARSHSANFLKKQMAWAVLGLGIMLLFAKLRYSHLKGASVVLLLFCTVCLVAVYWSPAINGSHRWLRLGPINFQPSEVAKLAMVMFMAAFATWLSDCIHDFVRCLLPCLGVLGLVCGLILFEPDFGASMVIAAIVFTMWFVAGFRKVHLFGLAAAGILVVPLLAALEPYRVARITVFFHPEQHLKSGGWQPWQSLIALGSGGLQGLGLGESRQKYQFLTESHTDFIFSIIGEETGLIGTTVVLLLFAALILMALRVASQTPDYFGMLLAYGLAAMLAIPTIVNLGVVTSSLPPKGLALPFVSYGGSSMLVNCIALGVLMNIASRNYGQKQT